jgi:lipopolysaccharide biosynthesis protein
VLLFLSRLGLNRRRRTAMRLISEDPSLKLFFRIIWEIITRPYLVTPDTWTPKNVLDSPGETLVSTAPKIAIIAHLYYEEYVDTLKSALQSFPYPYELMITTSNSQIAEDCQAAFESLGEHLIVRQVPNRGRNIGPLLVEFSAEIKNYDLAIHVHSKRSLHIENDLASLWSRELWENLLSDSKVVRRALNAFMGDSKIGIYYPLTSLLKFEVFSWALTEPVARKWAKNHHLRHISGAIAFPAGGMFWFRPAAIAPILDSNFTYSDFPEESGQVDETLHHALERLIGTVPLVLGFKHLIYHVGSGSLTTDIKFARKKYAFRNRAKRKAMKRGHNSVL